MADHARHSLACLFPVAHLRAMLGGADGEDGAIEPVFQVMEYSALLGGGQRLGGGEIDRELDLRIGRIDALAPWARRLRKPFGELCLGNP